MKLFPAKCNERATLRKLWCQTGNSSLLPAKCWPLFHETRGGLMLSLESQRVFQYFVLYCYIANHLMTGPLGNSEFCFPRILMFPLTSSWETLRFSGNKIHCSPRDQLLSVKYYFSKKGIYWFYSRDTLKSSKGIFRNVQQIYKSSYIAGNFFKPDFGRPWRISLNLRF